VDGSRNRRGRDDGWTVTSVDVYELLDTPLADRPPGLFDAQGQPDPAADHLLRHVIYGVAILQTVGDEYRELLAAKHAGSELPRDRLVELAGQLAAIIQSAMREPEAFQLSLPDAWMKPFEVIGAMEEVMHSLVLLADPNQDVDNLAITVDELDSLFAFPTVRELLADVETD
jgi:hypothetical protein